MLIKKVPSRNNPKFGIIAPTAYLNCTKQSSFHLVLAHLVDTDPIYADFYLERSKAGDFIILDNSAFELPEPYKPEKLISIGERIQADMIVLPDYPFSPGERTIEAAKEFAPQFIDAGFGTFFAPQSEYGDYDDWVNTYCWASESDLIDSIGLSILGIPNAIPHIAKPYARVVMVQRLIDAGVYNFNKYTHALGLNAGPALEIPSLINMRAINSCDSSNPVWMGILGHRYASNTDSLLSVSKVSKHVDFNYPMTKDESTLDNIDHNIQLTLELFGQ